MLSTIVAQQMRRLLNAFGSATLFNRLVEVLDDHHQSIQAFVIRMGKGNNLNESAANVHANFAGTYQCLQGISLRIVYRQGEQLLTELAALDLDADRDDPIQISAAIQSFLALIDSYSISRSATEATDLVRQASVIRARVAQTKTVFASLLSKLDPEPVPDDFESIVVLMDGNYELPDIVEVLNAVNEICTRISEVFASCGFEVTFRVRKVETGSLSWELFAQKIGIHALKQLLSRGLDYWYRNHTPEGLLKHQVPIHAASIREAMKIRNLLDKEGIDTERLDEALAEQAEFLVERIGIIARKAHGVRLDGHPVTSRLPRELPLSAATGAPRLGHDGDRSGV